MKNIFRIRLSGIAVNDVVNYDGGKNIIHFQREDLLSLGHILLCLACKSANATQTISKSLDFISSHYSSDLKTLIIYLLSKPSPVGHPNIDDVVSMISTRFIIENENLYK